MKKITIELTDDMLKLISHFSFKEFPVNFLCAGTVYAVDTAEPYGGSYFLEDASYALGIYDKHIEGTEEEPEGVRFPDEIEDYLWDMHGYIMEHLKEIEEIVHQFCNKGGLKPGKYMAKPNEHIWEYFEN